MMPVQGLGLLILPEDKDGGMIWWNIGLKDGLPD